MKEWWGLSKADGWVVLDRDINRSLNSDPSKIMFVRARDWKTVEIPLDQWKSIPNEATLAQHPDFTDLESIKNEWREIVKIRFFDELHRAFLKNLGLESKGIEKYLGDFRSTVCWSCKSSVDSDDSYKCLNCGWLICNSCGACKRNGCTQPLESTTLLASEGELIFGSFRDALNRAKSDPGLVVTRSADEGKWTVKKRI